MVASYIYNDMSRADAEARMQKGDVTDGDFLVRVRNSGRREYTIVILYRGRPTHHAVKPGPDGSLTINNLPCGGAQSIEDVIAYFSVPVSGWPVVLKRGITGPTKDSSLNIDLKDPLQTTLQKTNAKGTLPTPDVHSKEQSSEGLSGTSVESTISREQVDHHKIPEPDQDAVSTIRMESSDLKNVDSIPVISTKHASTDDYKKVELPTPNADLLLAAQKMSDEAAEVLEADAQALEAQLQAEEDAVRKSLKSIQGNVKRMDDESFDGFGDDSFSMTGSRTRLQQVAHATAISAQDSYSQLSHQLTDALGLLATLVEVERDPNSPSYLWIRCTKNASQKMLLGTSDGTFLLRPSNPPTTTRCLLDLVHGLDITTHELSQEEGGIWKLNGNDVGAYQNLDDLIERLKQPMKKWPQPLITPYVDPTKCKPRALGAGSGEQSKDVPSYLWNDISRTEVERLTNGQRDGTFLVRVCRGYLPKDGRYMLTIVYNNKSTHHGIDRTEAGLMRVNNKTVGGVTTLDDLIEYLRTPRKGWPVPLLNAIRPESNLSPIPDSPNDTDRIRIEKNVENLRTQLVDAENLADLAVTRLQLFLRTQVVDFNDLDMDSDKMELLKVLDKKIAVNRVNQAEQDLTQKEAALLELRQYARVQMPLPGRSVEVDPNNPSYLWSISATEAKEKLSGKPDGSYLVRSRDQCDDSTKRYILDLVFRGKVTHHSMSVQNGEFMVNGIPAGDKRTLDSVIYYLSSAKLKSWPIPPSSPIRNPEMRSPESEAVRKAAEDVAKAEVALDMAREILSFVNPDPRVPKRARKVLEGSKSVDTRNTAHTVIRELLHQRERKLHSVYERAVQTTLPLINDDHASILLSVMHEKLTTALTRKELSADPTQVHEVHHAFILINDVKNLRACLEDSLHALKGTDSEMKHAGILDEKMVLMEQALKSGKEDWLRLKKHRTQLLENGVTVDSIEGSGNSFYSLSGTNVQATAESDELRRVLSQLSSISTYMAKQQVILAEMRTIREDPVLLQFHMNIQDVIQGVLLSVSKIQKERDRIQSISKSLEECSFFSAGIPTGAGYMPVPLLTPQSVAVKLIRALAFGGGASEDTRMTTVCAEFARITTIRYQDQIRLLQSYDACRFAKWFGKPLLCALVQEVGGPVTRRAAAPFANTKEIVLRYDVAQKIKLCTVPNVSFPVHVLEVNSKCGDLRVGDMVVSINGIPCNSVDDAVRATSIGGPEKGTVRYKVSSQLGAIPSEPRGISGWLLRHVEAYDPDFRISEFSDACNVIEGAFDAVMGQSILGGKLWLYEYGVYASPEALILKPGLCVCDIGEIKFYHNPGKTDAGLYGYRRAVESAQHWYVCGLHQARVLGWDKFQESIGPNYVKLSMTYSKLSSSSLAGFQHPHKKASKGQGPIETIARQKTAEAQGLAIQVLDLQQEVERLSAALKQRQGVVSVPCGAKFVSALHG